MITSDHNKRVILLTYLWLVNTGDMLLQIHYVTLPDEEALARNPELSMPLVGIQMVSSEEIKLIFSMLVLWTMLSIFLKVPK